MSGSVLAEDSRRACLCGSLLWPVRHRTRVCDLLTEVDGKQYYNTGANCVDKSRDQSSGLKLSYFEPHYVVTGNGKEACSHLREAVCCSAVNLRNL